MALDMCRGERIGDMGDDYIVVPVSKWRNTPWFEQAAISATVSFGKVGGKFVYLPNLPHPFYRDEDVLVQEYRHPAALDCVPEEGCRAGLLRTVRGDAVSWRCAAVDRQ